MAFVSYLKYHLKIFIVRQFLNTVNKLLFFFFLSTEMISFIASSKQLDKVDTIVHFTPEETEHRRVK